MRRIALALLIALGAAAAPAGQAGAQTQIRACFVNSSSQAIVRQVRFVYTDWQGTRYEDNWGVLVNGDRHCRNFQDLQSLRFETRVFSGVHWGKDCSRNALPNRNATVIIAGTSVNPSCTLEQ